MPNLFTSVMRTLVPVVAGLLLSWAARAGLHLDSATTTAYVTAGLTAAYYLLFRGLEALAQRLAWQPLQLAAGLLLGWARPPSYEDQDQAVLPLKFKLDLDGMHEDLAALKRILGPDGDRK